MTVTAKAIVVTGLPASGKTRVGQELAARLGWPFLDKDDVLEALYEGHTVTTMEERRKLSRLSDNLFKEAACAQNNVVLVSHWGPANGTGVTGTPTDWIGARFSHLIEVHCACSAEVATRRFIARRRHPGHLDSLRNQEDTAKKMQSLSGGYPLGLGVTLSVNTEAPYDADEVYRQVKAALGAFDQA